ncbi:MAG: hypothetical protein NTU93_09485 [Arthrobacter sp.]|nr:hypothetical protein [Arthrobacter sp.]
MTREPTLEPTPEPTPPTPPQHAAGAGGHSAPASDPAAGNRQTVGPRR